MAADWLDIFIKLLVGAYGPISALCKTGSSHSWDWFAKRKWDSCWVFVHFGYLSRWVAFMDSNHFFFYQMIWILGYVSICLNENFKNCRPTTISTLLKGNSHIFTLMADCCRMLLKALTLFVSARNRHFQKLREILTRISILPCMHSIMVFLSRFLLDRELKAEIMCKLRTKHWSQN